MNARHLPWIAALFALALGRPSAAEPPTLIRVVVPAGVDARLLTTAQARGLDIEEGIRIQLLPVDGTKAALDAATGGSADAFALSANDVVEPAHNRAVVILGLARQSYVIATRKGAAVKCMDIPSLAGRSVAVTPDAGVRLALLSSARRVGFTERDGPRARQTGSAAEAIRSVASGQAFAAALSPADGEAAARSGLRVAPPASPGNAARTLFFLAVYPEALKARPEAYQALARTLLRAEAALRALPAPREALIPSADPDADGLTAIAGLSRNRSAPGAAAAPKPTVNAAPYQQALTDLSQRYPDVDLYHTALYALGDGVSIPDCCK